MVREIPTRLAASVSVKPSVGGFLRGVAPDVTTLCFMRCLATGRSRARRSRSLAQIAEHVTACRRRRASLSGAPQWRHLMTFNRFLESFPRLAAMTLLADTMLFAHASVFKRTFMVRCVQLAPHSGEGEREPLYEKGDRRWDHRNPNTYRLAFRPA